MPLYEVFCLARPSLAKGELSELLKRSCKAVLDGNGVITRIESNGVIPLCHPIKKTHGHYAEVRLNSVGVSLNVSLSTEVSEA
jgi:ribosomal protein S6